MAAPRVSVIIPTFNNAATIEVSVRSALAQTEKSLEVVVVDDGSRDGTASIVSRLAESDGRLKLIRHGANRGAAAARNTAIDAALGEWIALLDADDRFEPERIRHLLTVAREGRYDIVCDELQLYDVGADRVFDRTSHARGAIRPLTAALLFASDTPLRRHRMGYIQPMFRRGFAESSGIRYDERHAIGHDFVFLAEMLLSGARAAIIPMALYVYTVRWGPVSGAHSPHARVRGRSTLLVRACDELLEKYRAKLVQEERILLSRRRQLLQRNEDYVRLRTTGSGWSGLLATAVLLVRPRLVPFVLAGLRNRILTTWLRWTI
jgi:succinoglycan biosynthesis protein ExoO